MGGKKEVDGRVSYLQASKRLALGPKRHQVMGHALAGHLLDIADPSLLFGGQCIEARVEMSCISSQKGLITCWQQK
jgi:hypothetical protein